MTGSVFRPTVSNVSLTFLENPISPVAVVVRRPVLIRGNGNGTVIDGGGGTHTLINNLSSELRLISLRFQNAGTALNNSPTATAQLFRVRVTSQSRRAVINQGRMSMLLVTIFNNPGGGISNANAVPVEFLAAGAVTSLLSDICNPECLSPGNTSTTATSFPAGQAPAGLTVTLSTIRNNGPAPCAGLANGGGVIQDQGGIGGIGGNPLIREKLEGVLTLTRSRVTENNAGNQDGGGICNQSVAMISQTEISRNQAARGGGLALPGLSLTLPTAPFRSLTIIANSTVSTNVAE